MSVYLSVAQAQNIVFELMEIVPKGVSVADENGCIIASSSPTMSGIMREIPPPRRCSSGTSAWEPLS